jgi:V8-like Glu-specific endopeptidase
MAFMKTMRVGLSLLTLLVAACAEEDHLPNADPPKLYDITRASEVMRQAAKAVVRIQHPAGSSGTGSFISEDGLLLTNNHVLGSEACAREGCQILLSFQHQAGNLELPPRRLFAVPQHVDSGLDMAVLQVFMDKTQQERLPTPYFLSFETRSASELVGQHVTAIGHPLGRLKKWSDGVVIHAEGDWFESSIFSLPGGSGSPILNDQGKLVGLLHRGSDGFDLITRTSAQVSALASAAQALEQALLDPLPASVISVDDALTRDAVLARTGAYLAAEVAAANVDGASVPLISLLGEACDEGLTPDDYDSLEALQSALQPCFTTLDFIECRSDADDDSAAKLCPEEREPWRARLQAVTTKQRAFNGSLELSAISYSMEALADSTHDGERMARDNIVTLLDEAKPPFDFSLAYYLSAYGIESYDSQRTRDFIVGYAKVPFYERSAWEIALSALWLYSADLLERDQTLKIVKALYKSDKVSLGAKLRIEEVLYNSGEL